MKFLKVFILIGAVCASSASNEVESVEPEAANGKTLKLLLLTLNCAKFPVDDIIRYLLDQLIQIGTQAVNRQIIKFLESQRPNFSTGWPAIGIPALDPYAIQDISTSIEALGQ